MDKVRVYVVGVGMTKFEKPGRRENFDYPEMAKESVSKALADAKIDYTDIKQAVVSYVYGESTCGQRALYQFGMTGIPIYNVNNNGCTGSTGLILAKQIIEAGKSDCVMALGFEKMERGTLEMKWNDRAHPADKLYETLDKIEGFEPTTPSAQPFGNAGEEVQIRVL